MKAITSLCVYLGSAPGSRQVYATAALKLGQLMADRGIRLIYGGGRFGLIRELADSVLRSGGSAVGILPDFLRQGEEPRGRLHELRIVKSMHERKQTMFELADAFAVLPGGLGTLDETFEIVTWRQLSLHDKPVVLVNIDGYWNPLLQLIDHAEAEEFVQGARDFFAVADDLEGLFELLERAPAPVLPTAPERL